VCSVNDSTSCPGTEVCCGNPLGCYNNFNNCPPGLIGNAACLEANGVDCAEGQQCCKTQNGGDYECQASGTSCPMR